MIARPGGLLALDRPRPAVRVRCAVAKRVGRISLTVALVATGALFAAGAASGAPPALAYSYTGVEQTYTVPAGVTAVTITAVGAPGGSGPRNTNTTPTPGAYPGGDGASVTATVAVTPGETLYVEVGGPGGSTDCSLDPVVSPAFNGGGGNGCGGGGGGASDVRTCSISTCSLSSADTRLVVAGGGGGGGGAAHGCVGGAGGQAGDTAATGAGAGGAGYSPCTSPGGPGGNGGRGSPAGMVGSGYAGGSTDGTLGAGGNSGYGELGGGGGGGYFGGGAGGYDFAGGGGGAGSSFWETDAVGTSMEEDSTATAGLTVTVASPPSINTVQQSGSATVGSAVADEATVTGGDSPSGTVTFDLYANANATGTALFSDTQALSAGSATSAGYTTTATGTDYWVATYNGDSNNLSATSPGASGPVTITKASPSISTVQRSGSATIGSAVADEATVTGGDSPSGTVTFDLFSNAAGTGTALFSDTETLSAGSATSAGYTTTATGTDYWVATYNGDSNNLSATSPPGPEPVTSTTTAHRQQSNRFTIDAHGHNAAGMIELTITVPGPGRVYLLGTHSNPPRALATVSAAQQPGHDRFAWARHELHAAGAGTMRVTLAPNAAGARMLRYVRTKGWSLHIRVWVTYTPAGGHPSDHVMTIRVVAATPHAPGATRT